jgi:hypothetical protein
MDNKRWWANCQRCEVAVCTAGREKEPLHPYKNNKKKHKRKKGYEHGDHRRDTPKRRKEDEGLLGSFSLSNLDYGDVVAYSLIIAGGIYLYGKFIKDK